MPLVVGDFISRHVYDSKLGTVHPIRTKACCRFVDVSNGKEIKKGVSWVVRLSIQDTDLLCVADIYLPLRTKEKSEPSCK